MKRKSKRRIKRIMARATRRAMKAGLKYAVAKLVGRSTCGQWVERRYPNGGLIID